MYNIVICRISDIVQEDIVHIVHVVHSDIVQDAVHVDMLSVYQTLYKKMLYIAWEKLK